MADNSCSQLGSDVPAAGISDTCRKELRRLVPQMRQLLTDDLAQMLEARFGVHRTGAFEPLSALPAMDDPRERETRELLAAMLPPPPDSRAARQAFAECFDELLRALAFTHLNRLVAFKLMEHPSRKLIPETVGRGPGSRGFLLWAGRDEAGDELLRQGREGDAYRRFLLARCREWDAEIRLLFDPDDLAGRVWPSHQALMRVITLVNDSRIGDIWASEEALGWVYQFYTPKEMRDAARKAAPAPRNPDEMAFLNQFYTPEYVVRFLVDNTLGRLWLEMRGGESVLRERCAMLAVKPGEELPARAIKDPRGIRVLDPACGSGHFLLYAFQVLVWIYREAWGDPRVGPRLRREFDDLDAFTARIPALILEHNLHGIDIDRRATQLAALTLFLKAKAASPTTPIERANIVWAAPMPGDRERLEAFKERTLAARRGVLARLLDRIWEKLALAGEVGSVLQLPEGIAAAIAEQESAWRRRDQLDVHPSDFALLPEAMRPRQAKLDFSDVASDDSWKQMEAELLRRLTEFAEEAEGVEGARRRLFQRDSAAGFHFVEVIGKAFDVMLMNPPFGAATPKAKDYLVRHYPRTKNDIYGVFVERFLQRLTDGGYLGAITSRTGFFLSSFRKWREEVLLREAVPVIVADLGHGVMDNAMVEAAAYVLRKT